MSVLSLGDLAAYGTANHERRQLVRGRRDLNGIDWIEVEPGQRTLRVYLLNHPGPEQRLHPHNVDIAGGERVVGIRVTSVHTDGLVVTVMVDRPGDWSTYELRIVDDRTGGPHAQFDPILSAIPFSFKAGCPTGLDPPGPAGTAPTPVAEPALDYLAKDYASFVQLMSDRLASTMPGWTERNPADVGVTIVELLAYVADYLSYYQDAVATESTLYTARQRVSVRRHALLLGYHVSEGCSARVFLTFFVDAPVLLPTGTGAVAEGAGNPPPVFETLHDLGAKPGNNRLSVYAWSDDHLVLAVGTTSATLVDPGAADLAPGMFVLLQGPTGPERGSPVHAQVVRLTAAAPAVDPLDETKVVTVGWAEADALSAPLWVSGGQAWALANVALADHGASVVDTPLTDGMEPPARWRPRLRQSPLTFAVPFDARVPAAELSASDLLAPDPAAALPAVVLQEAGTIWEPLYDLLGADGDAANFVVEVESDGTARIRFGDGTNGRQPAGRDMVASYRYGSGTAGNVGAGAITRLLDPQVSAGVTVTNPLPAAGGQEPETMPRILRRAPHVRLEQRRAVTEDDYACAIVDQPGVDSAAGRLRWTGSWYSAVVTVERQGGRPLESDGFAARLGALLDVKRMAGVDTRLAAPVPVPIELALHVVVLEGAIAATVRRLVLDALSARVLPDGRKAFFHPDNFTLGQPVYLSNIYRAVLAVEGVDRTQATVFQPYGDPLRSGLAEGRITVGHLEVVRLL
jgi:hypothetical protein